MIKKLPPQIVLASIIIVLGLLIGFFQAVDDGRLQLNFYDVWQGDSALLRGPKGATILVDGGPDEAVLAWLGKDLPFYQRQLDLLVLTHPHADHLTGLLEVLKRYQVGAVLMPKLTHTTDEYLSFLDLIYTKNIKVYQARQGQQLALGGGRIKLKVLWPPQGYVVGSDLNEASVVLRLQYGRFEALLAGDAPATVQWQLLTNQQFGPIAVFKVPHHGASDALADLFLAQIKPKLSVISVGKKNRFGHPSSQTLGQLADIGSRVLRTDIDGTVRVVVEKDGKWEARVEK